MDALRIEKEWRKLVSKFWAKTICRFLKSCPFLDSYEPGEDHHILWRSRFPQYLNAEWNIIRLSVEDHIRAHALMCAALPMDRTLRAALHAVALKRPAAWEPKNPTKLMKRLQKSGRFRFSQNAIGKEFGVSGSVIGAWMKRHRIIRPADRSFSQKDKERIVKLYPRLKTRAIAKLYGSNHSSILAILHGQGAIVLSKHEAHRICSPEKEEKIVEMYMKRPSPSGRPMSQALVGEKFGLDQGTVFNILRRHNIKTRSNREAHAVRNKTGP